MSTALFTYDANPGRVVFGIGSLARVAWSGYPHSQANHAMGNLAQSRTDVVAALELCEQKILQFHGLIFLRWGS